MAGGVSGKCYCGAHSIAAGAPLSVVYCHCTDCKRWTGAPLPAFAGVSTENVRLPEGLPPRRFGTGVTRWNCEVCGSPLAAAFDYLPGQIFLPLGILDQIDDLAPSHHCHAAAQAPWLHLDDDLPRSKSSGRVALNRAADPKA